MITDLYPSDMASEVELNWMSSEKVAQSRVQRALMMSVIWNADNV